VVQPSRLKHKQQAGAEPWPSRAAGAPGSWPWRRHVAGSPPATRVERSTAAHEQVVLAQRRRPRGRGRAALQHAALLARLADGILPFRPCFHVPRRRLQTAIRSDGKFFFSLWWADSSWFLLGFGPARGHRGQPRRQAGRGLAAQTVWTWGTPKSDMLYLDEHFRSWRT
jgi:hypothetical protein